MQAEQRDHGDWNLGYTRLEQLSNVSEADLRALAACGLSFARRG
jgi:hypothetical protein